MKTESSNIDHVQGSTDVSPNKIDRTFGSSIDQSLVGRESLSGNNMNDSTDEGAFHENTRFTREMKILGHGVITSPKSVKSKLNMFLFYEKFTIHHIISRLQSYFTHILCDLI